MKRAVRLAFFTSIAALLSFRANGVMAAAADTVFCDSTGHGANSGDPRVNTALGCIPVGTTGQFMEWLLPYVFGITGGIAFLLMVKGFIDITMSSGDPKKVAEASSGITAALSGLLISIFAIFLLRLIAVDILQIPGLTK